MKKCLSLIVVLSMLLSTFTYVSAASVDYNAHDDYYKVISKEDYELAPGIMESEIVLNNASGTHRQVAHVVEVDLNNEYTKVLPSYMGMVPKAGSYGVQIMSQQAKWAEANGYGNVVAAMNLSLSWYDSAYYKEHPELVGEPLGYMVLNGNMYVNSQGMTSGAQTCVVINFDEKDGEVRPTDIPKVEIRSTSSAITGWEEQVIPANFGFLVKDGVNQYKKDNNGANGASRSFVGIKEDGTFVMVMNDGRQAPYSTGFTNYEMAEFMLSLGCVQAVNGDGGGSSAFLSQRPGEDLKINCSPSDGAERPTTHGILVISQAPATGEFVRATISAENDYYTPGSTVVFNALGTDLVGTAADIPDDVTWQLADPSMGSIENGVFVSGGKEGTATAQMVYNGDIVGEASVEIVVPTEFSFSQAVMTVPFDKEVTIGLTATINSGIHNVVLKPEDVTFSTTNSALGSFNGFNFTSVSVDNAPENLKSMLTATLVHNTELVATAELNLGKGSEVLFDFENVSDIDEWNIADVNGNDEGFYQNLSYATSVDGQVHDGVGSMRVEMNPISGTGISSGGYAQSDLFLDRGVIVENAKSIGFWAYIPDEYEHCWIRVLYWYDSNDDGIYDKKNTITVINQPEVYNTVDESGWKYFSVDVSAYSSILIPGLDSKTNFGYNAAKNDANNFRFIEFMFPHTNTNDLWKTYGTINGLQTVYVDNITADFSDAVDDREAPVFSSVSLSANDESIALEKHNTVKTTSNLLTVTAAVAENTTKTNATGLDVASAKAYVDGVPVNVTYANGRMTISDVAVADGVHRIKFEICDNMGNKSVVVRLVEVDADVDASTIQVVPADPTLNSLYGGSVYWMNLNATDIETIQSVETVIDLNYGNHWELDHMELAEGFTSSYSIDEENNTATIVITRTGESSLTGAATLASLPIRVIYYDTDINIKGYDAETYWSTYAFWPHDLKVDVDMGEITYGSGYTSAVLNAFSNEEFSVDTEIYTAFQDAAFKAERGTAHVHTPVELEDSAASCTEAGISGRTFCNDCNSVVEWGTVEEITGHSFTVEEDGLYTCDECGNTYYYINGTQQKGWIEVDGKNYYLHNNGIAANGEATIDGHTYVFTDFVLTEGAWEDDGIGTSYWWAGERWFNDWLTIGDKKYHFTGFYVKKGVQKVAINTDVGGIWYIFDDVTGELKSDINGIYPYDGDIYYAKDGAFIYAGLVQDDEGNYYYIRSNLKAVKNTVYGIHEEKTNGLLPAGSYKFDADGKIILEKTGLVKDADGEIRYYVAGEAIYAGLVQDIEGNYYYINSSKKAVKSTTYYIYEAKTNGLISEGTYEFGADGKMVDQSSQPGPDEPVVPDVKNGLVKDADGEVRYYINDVAQYAGVVQDDEGNYYYINSSKKAVKNTTYYIYEAKTNGLISEGIYEFGAGGKMVDQSSQPGPDEPVVPDVKNGLVKDADGEVRYYINDVAQYAGVVQDDEGNYYYINSSKKAVKNTTYYIYEAKTNGLISEGTYEFGADGKMVDQSSQPGPDEPVVPDVKNGLVKDADGEIRYYINDVAQYAGVVQDDEGNYYYINSSKKAVKNRTYYIYEAKTNGLISEGAYEFGADGKMIIE